MKVRILKIPDEVEMDGIQLNHLTAGTVLEVSPSVGSWLIVQGYAVLEMRNDKRRLAGSDSSKTDRAHDRRKKNW